MFLEMTGGYINFYLDDKHIYTYMIPAGDIEIKEDLQIVEDAVEKLKNDHKRWLEQNAQVVRKNYDKFTLFDRTSYYHATYDDNDPDHVVTIGLIEDCSNNFVITLKDNVTKAYMRTSVVADSKEEILDTMEKLGDLIFNLLTPFKNGEEQLRLAHFNEYVLGE